MNFNAVGTDSAEAGHRLRKSMADPYPRVKLTRTGGPTTKCNLLHDKCQSWSENIKKAIITLQAWRLKLKSFNQACISSKSIMQITMTIFAESAIVIEIKNCRKSFVGKN